MSFNPKHYWYCERKKLIPQRSAVVEIGCHGSNPPTISEVCDTPITNNHGGTNSPTQYIDTIAWWRPTVCSRNVAINIKVTIVRHNKIKPFKYKVFKQIWTKIIFLKHILLTSLWLLLWLCADQSAVYTFCIQAMYTDPGPQEIGSFCRYRGTVYVQQKKQYNQTINLQENSIVWFLWFFHDDGTCRKTHKIWHKST